MKKTPKKKTLGTRIENGYLRYLRYHDRPMHIKAADWPQHRIARLKPDKDDEEERSESLYMEIRKHKRDGRVLYAAYRRKGPGWERYSAYIDDSAVPQNSDTEGSKGGRPDLDNYMNWLGNDTDLPNHYYYAVLDPEVIA